jgi:LuxR family maltose regulon positive regulatory protein
MPTIYNIYISRPRLLEQFTTPARLVYLYGPTGSGKTALLHEWSRLQSDHQVVWLTCSEIDNDPLCLWLRLAQAIGIPNHETAFAPDIFPTTLGIALVSLVTWVAQQPQSLSLILDDYHLLRTAESRAFVRDLLQILPNGLRIFMASQARDAELPLSRWGVSGQAIEITPADLLFTPAEIETLLESMAMPATDETIQTLVEQTNGWVAGVQLALQHDVRHSVRPSQIMSDLCTAVFSELPSQTQTFLSECAILDVLTVDACRAITQNPLSATFLQTLLNEGLLLADIPAGYRIPAIWQRFLQDKIGLAEPLHRRAIAWYQHANDPDRAIHHALLTDEAVAADMIRTQGRIKLARGELVTLRRWLEHLPETTILADADLSILFAWALVHSGDLAQTERYLHHPDQPIQAIYAVRARIAAMQGDKTSQIEYSEKALPHIPDTDFSLRAETCLNLGCAFLETGALQQAQPVLKEALHLSRAAQNPRAGVFASFFLGKVHLAQGRLAQALREYEGGLAIHATLPIAGVLHVGIAEILYEQNKHVAAKNHLDQALAMGEGGGEIKPLVYATIALGALIPPAEAIQRLAAAAALTGWPLIYAWQTLWWLQTGNTTLAAAWLTDTQANGVPLSEFERMVQARVLICLQHREAARGLLDDLATRAMHDQRRGDLLKIHLLQMRYHWDRDETHEAANQLRQTLELGESEGYLRSFLNEGSVFHHVGTALAQEQPENRYLRTLLWHSAETASRSVVLPFGETLSEREMDVLMRIAQGHSNETIAGQLFLTVGTVKWHVHNILGKLEVKSRTEAIRRAKELQLPNFR